MLCPFCHRASLEIKKGIIVFYHKMPSTQRYANEVYTMARLSICYKLVLYQMAE